MLALLIPYKATYFHLVLYLLDTMRRLSLFLVLKSISQPRH
nr:MAG TPA: hypothetical protein [Bacteriophage sp.]